MAAQWRQTVQEDGNKLIKLKLFRTGIVGEYFNLHWTEEFILDRMRMRMGNELGVGGGGGDIMVILRNRVPFAIIAIVGQQFGTKNVDLQSFFLFIN